MPDSDFATVRLDTLEPAPGTPAEAPGIHIAAPAHAPRADGGIALCGYLEFTHAQLVRFADDFPDPRIDLRLVACAPALGLVRAGHLDGIEDRERQTYPELAAEESEGTGIALYFNVDLAAQLGIPDTAATWHVYAYFAGHVSNTVTIRVGPRS